MSLLPLPYQVIQVDTKFARVFIEEFWVEMTLAIGVVFLGAFFIWLKFGRK